LPYIRVGGRENWKGVTKEAVWLKTPRQNKSSGGFGAKCKNSLNGNNGVGVRATKPRFPRITLNFFGPKKQDSEAVLS